MQKHPAWLPEKHRPNRKLDRKEPKNSLVARTRQFASVEKATTLALAAGSRWRLCRL